MAGRKGHGAEDGKEEMERKERDGKRKEEGQQVEEYNNSGGHR